MGEAEEFVRALLEFAESFERIPSYGLLDVDDFELQVDLLAGAGAGVGVGVGAVYAGNEQRANSLVLVLTTSGWPASPVLSAWGL